MGSDLTGILNADAASNTKAINAAVAAESFDQGAVIELPAGKWPIDDTILIQNKIGITLRGKGRHATRLDWARTDKGASTNSMIELRNSRSCVIEDIEIQGSSDPESPPFAAIESRRYPSGGYENKLHVFRNLVINYSGYTRHGIVFSSSKNPDPDCWKNHPCDCSQPPDPNMDRQCCAVDGDNDLATLMSVSVLHAEEACLALMHSSSVGHLLLGCVFGDAKYGVACGYYDPARAEPGLQIGGGFTWIGGAVSNHTESDFWLNFVGSTGLVSITGANSEGSQRFILSERNHMLKNTVSIRDCRISTSLAQDKLPSATFPHRIMVDHLAPGPLTLTGCTFHGRAIPMVHLLVEQPTVHHVTGNIWSMAGSDVEDCILKEVSPEIYAPDPKDNTPGGQLVIEEGNVFLNSNDQLNSLGTGNQCRGVEIFRGDGGPQREFLPNTPTHTVRFTSKERNLLRKNEAYKPTNPSLYYVALSVEVDEMNPPADDSRHATINTLTDEGFNIRIGGPPGLDKEVRVHWMIMR